MDCSTDINENSENIDFEHSLSYVSLAMENLSNGSRDQGPDKINQSETIILSDVENESHDKYATNSLEMLKNGEKDLKQPQFNVSPTFSMDPNNIPVNILLVDNSNLGTVDCALTKSTSGEYTQMDSDCRNEQTATPSPSSSKRYKSVSFSRRTTTPKQLLAVMVKEAVADVIAYSGKRRVIPEPQEEEYVYVSERSSGKSTNARVQLIEKTLSITSITNSQSCKVAPLIATSATENVLDSPSGGRAAVMTTEVETQKHLTDSKEALLEKKIQEDLLSLRHAKAPNFGFSNIKAGLKLQDYQGPARHPVIATPVPIDTNVAVLMTPPVPYYYLASQNVSTTSASDITSTTSETHSNGFAVVELEPDISDSQPVAPSTTLLNCEGQESGAFVWSHDLTIEQKQRLYRETALQQSCVREAISDNLIDQRFGWHRNYYAGNSAQQRRSYVDVGSGSLPPTAKSNRITSHVADGASEDKKPTGGIALLGKLPSNALPPLALLPPKVSVSTIMSSEAPEFVSHIRKRLSVEQLQYDLSSSSAPTVSGGAQDSDSLDGQQSLCSSVGGTSMSSSHYRIVNTSTAHSPYKTVKANHLESIADETATESAVPTTLTDEQEERRQQLLDQLKRSCYVDPARDISWRLASMLNETPAHSRRPQFQMDVFEHSMNLRAGKLLNAYRPWSTVKADEFDYEHFQAVMQEAAAAATALKSNAKRTLSPIVASVDSPKALKATKSKRVMFGSSNQLGGSKRSHANLNKLSQQQQHHHSHHHKIANDNSTFSSASSSPVDPAMEGDARKTRQHNRSHNSPQPAALRHGLLAKLANTTPSQQSSARNIKGGQGNSHSPAGNTRSSNSSPTMTPDNTAGHLFDNQCDSNVERHHESSSLSVSTSAAASTIIGTSPTDFKVIANNKVSCGKKKRGVPPIIINVVKITAI